VRGNLQTRIKKMENGQCDAMLLAFAGVHRMEYDHLILQHMPLDIFTPAVGQGSVAVEIHERLAPDKKEIIRKQVNHPPTEIRLRAERAYLKTIEGGCSIPAFALAELHKNELQITGGIISMDGQRLIRHHERGELAQAEELGKQLAERVLADGGAEIVAGFKG
jgi:hydroxymethylbilane synthase